MKIIEEKGDLDTGNITDGLGEFLLRDNKDEPDTNEVDPKPEEPKTEEPKPDDNADDNSLEDIELDFKDVEVPEETEDDPKPEEAVTDEKAHKALERMRRERDEALAKIEEAKSSANTEELNRLKAQLKEAHDIIGKVSLENHPEFKSRYDKPTQRYLTQAKQILKQFDIDESVADHAASLPLVERVSYLSDRASEVVSMLMPIYTQIDGLQLARDEELSNYEQSLESLTQQQINQQNQQIMALKDQHFNSAITELSASKNIAFTEIPGNEKHNMNVKKIKNVAKAIFNSDDPAILSKYVLQGVSTSIYQQMHRVEVARREAAEAELAKLGRARPRIGSNSSGAKNNNKPVDRISSDKIGDMIKWK